MPDSPLGLADFLEFGESAGFWSPAIRSTAHPEGKQYFVPSPDGHTGAKLSALSTIAMKAHGKVEVSERDIQRLRLNDDEERDVMQMALGKAYDELMADGAAWEHITRLGKYAFIYFTAGPTMAEDAAAAGVFLGKKAPAQNRATRRKTGAGQTTAKASTVTKNPRRPRA